jgi:hypothetical protein
MVPRFDCAQQVPKVLCIVCVVNAHSCTLRWTGQALEFLLYREQHVPKRSEVASLVAVPQVQVL